MATFYITWRELAYQKKGEWHWYIQTRDIKSLGNIRDADSTRLILKGGKEGMPSSFPALPTAVFSSSLESRRHLHAALQNPPDLISFASHTVATGSMQVSINFLKLHFNSISQRLKLYFSFPTWELVWCHSVGICSLFLYAQYGSPRDSVLVEPPLTSGSQWINAVSFCPQVYFMRVSERLSTSHPIPWCN